MTHLRVLLASCILTTTMLIPTPPAVGLIPAAGPTCGSDFESDVFTADSGWSRSSPTAATSGGGLLVFPSDGKYSDHVDESCLLTAPFTIEMRARITAGGQNYVVPSLGLLSNGTEVLTTTVLPDGAQACHAGPAQHGWYLGNWDAQDAWTQNVPYDVACEGQWMSIRLDVAPNGSAVYSRLDDSTTWLLARSTTSASVGPFDGLHIYQPWDARIEVDYLHVLLPEPAGTLARVIIHDGDTTRASLAGVNASIQAHDNANTGMLAGLLARLSESLDATRDGLASAISSLTQQITDGFAALDADVGRVESKIDIANSKLDAISGDLGANASADPLHLQLAPSPQAGDGRVAILVTLRGTPHDADLAFALDGVPFTNATFRHFATGTYAFDTAQVEPSAMARLLVATAAFDGHQGSAIAWLSAPGGTKVPLG